MNMIVGQGLELELGLYRNGAWMLQHNVLIFIDNFMSLLFIKSTAAYMKDCNCDLCSFTVFSISSCMFYFAYIKYHFFFAAIEKLGCSLGNDEDRREDNAFVHCKICDGNATGMKDAIIHPETEIPLPL